MLETEVLNLTGYIISKNKWRKYLPGFSIINYNDIEVWINFLIQLEAKMLALLGDVQKIKDLFILRKQMYNWKSSNIIKIKRITNTKITDFFIGGEKKSNDDDTNNNTNNAIEELEDTIAVHTTSYEQLNFIKENISDDNLGRLLVTDPSIQRDEVIAEHINSIKPTVLISPSLYTGIDLKNDLSRFQIITKIPYPNLGDRWINAKRYIDEEWYYWQTALRLVQAYGRSIRSKEDWAKTYILDSAFSPFVNKNRDLFPAWFRLAIRDYS